MRRLPREVGLLGLGCIRSGRPQCVARDLTRGVGRRPDPERRVQRRWHLAGGSVGRKLRQPSHQRARDGLTRRVEPSEIGTYVTTFESVGAGTEHSRRRRHRFLVLCAGERERNRLGGRREKGEEPVELVGKRCERSHRPGGTGRAVLGAQEALAQNVDGAARAARGFG